MTEQMIATLIGQLGVGGSLAWFMWYLLTRSLPDKDKAHADERKEMRTTIKEDRTQDRAEDRAFRTVLHAETIASNDRLGDKIERLSDLMEKALAAGVGGCENFRPRPPQEAHREGS